MKLTQNGNPQLFDRKEIKASMMQASYGQREKGTKAQLAQDMGAKYSDEIYDLYQEAVDDVLPGFNLIMDWVNSLWNKNWEEVSWVMPDGFRVTCKPTASDWVKFNPFGLFEVKSKVSGVQKEDNALILFVTIIHSVDGFIMREMVKRANDEKFELYGIHDGNRFLPNNAPKAKHNYNEILADINDIPLFENILEQITGQKVEILGTNIKREEILKAKYSIC